ncbi:hypothetical protein J437_LFUL005365 [Ladona fulva]|uniref:Uncharacterized protein n=1 Tax=Ladona fulva TaxID=123851 RepID=A0A8K0NUR4_LADFU|nr:hypothetical protein J437_LFUL005365 [Ladona fulva]
MKVLLPVLLFVLFSTDVAKGLFFNKEKTFGFRLGYSSSPQVIVNHHYLSYDAPPVTKVAYAVPPLPYVTPVTKVAYAPQPVALDVPAVQYAAPAIPYPAPWPVYQPPVAVTKVAYAPAQVAAPGPIFTKFAYADPFVKK